MLKTGIVIGSYALPETVRLNIRAIRHLCPDAAILVSEDHSSKWREVKRMAAEEGVYFRCNRHRLGHPTGDVGAFRSGLLWAKHLGIDVLCKLSQRFIVHGEEHRDWLNRYAEQLMARPDVALATKRCQEGPIRFRLRTEAMLMKVAEWTRPEVIDHLKPSCRCAEVFLWRTVKAFFRGRFMHWPMLSVQRRVTLPGILWHCGNEVEEYLAVGDRFGVDLRDELVLAGWKQIEGAKYR